ncbi:FabD/lysophospholipase-like protein, partial [Dissoconium aciculare CBS 342.82]|uniref:FabD/lysophospholipase-like protein n=1 Tax=Dissoconium aciculare CBS 342.82 TaxID=1314786 RepID=A0A6J3MA27_9PEZI
LRRKDTSKGVPLRVLSLDGGGIRGYSMLIILQELMHRTFVEIEGRAPKRHEIPKPCDHFDLIAGNGTGGLIAIMLGRLRLDLDTCKEVYVRMTRRVFESDKTLLGMPLKGTMFKATKLEESIRDCVREHTVFDHEGNDSLANAVPMTPGSPINTSTPSTPHSPNRTMSQGSRYSQIGRAPSDYRTSFNSSRLGNPNALLYDTRENRTKTAVTAVLKGTPVTTLLRSYDSRREAAPDVNCTIWQAGRATAATQMAFKPIQIGQSVYLDEGAGRYNPSPMILDEAVQNEWPGRAVGVFVSIGTGKRPASTTSSQHEWWAGLLGSSMDDFADARRKMIAKLEACEDIHEFMVNHHLAARGVAVEDYFRFNVEIGVGEFGMNEWNRLADISINTRRYLAENATQTQSANTATKLAKVHLAKIRHERAEARRQYGHDGPQYGQPGQQSSYNSRPSQAGPIAVELPGDETFPEESFYERMHNIADQKYPITASDPHYTPHHSTLNYRYS